MNKPNIILVMCDDLGYGDTGFNGNQIIKTPNLDQLAAEGAVFTRFYAGGPVCSPTRGTCLTGRHYSRYSINHANQGCLPTQEITIAEVLKQSGYTTGHFGKWHLGTLTKDVVDGRRGGREEFDCMYSPPWLHHFDTCYSTEIAVPLWIPPDKDTWFTYHYWTGPGQFDEQELQGDDSRVIMDQAIPFIEKCASEDQPFLSVVWFHAPHEPVVAGPEYRTMYSEYPENKQHYYGCVTAMDEQVGRLNQTLKQLGIDDNTMLWFCSDNGPEGRDPDDDSRYCGSTGGYKGRKRSLFNGGIAVPALLKWPDKVKPGTTYDMPCSTLDYFPTIAALMNYEMPDSRPIDGMDIMPMINGEMTQRPKPIPYRFKASRDAMFGSPTLAMIDNQFKFLTNLCDSEQDICYDLENDPFENHDVKEEQKDVCSTLKEHLENFINSCRQSHHGADYHDPDFQPVNDFQEPDGWV